MKDTQAAQIKEWVVGLSLLGIFTLMGVGICWLCSRTIPTHPIPDELPVDL